MEWSDAIDEIESIDFDVRLNVVSSFSLFMRSVREEPAVAAMSQAMQSSEKALETVLEHVCELSRREIDTQYENPGDTALAVCLWLLSLVRPSYANIGALCVVGAPNCFYAWKVARLVLLPPSASASAGDMMTGQNGATEPAVASGTGGWVFNPCPLASGAGKVLAEPAMPTMAAGGRGGA